MAYAAEARAVNTDERDWVLRAQAGEPQALDLLVRNHVQLVRRLLTRILGPRQDLDDLVQTTFLELLRALPGFRHESALSTFVAGIAVRVARRALRPTLLQRFSKPLDDEPLAPSVGNDEQLIARQALARVRRALEQLSEPKRVAFLLWSLEGMTIPEIARVTEASDSATQSRIFYAQKELLARAAKDPWLREWLEEQNHEPT